MPESLAQLVWALAGPLVAVALQLVVCDPRMQEGPPRQLSLLQGWPQLTARPGVRGALLSTPVTRPTMTRRQQRHPAIP